MVVPAGVGASGTLSINGPDDNQNVLAEPTVGLGKFLSIGTDLVMDKATGDIYFQGVLVSVGSSWPPSPASVSVPVSNFSGRDHNVPLGPVEFAPGGQFIWIP